LLSVLIYLIDLKIYFDMKTCGYIAIVVGCLEFIVFICELIASGQGEVPGYAFTQSLTGTFVFLGVGLLLLHLARRKEKEKQQFHDWNK